MIKAILFDLDGTMADTDPIHFLTWQDVLRPYGLEFDKPFYNANFSGRLNQKIIQDLLPHLSLLEGEALSDRKEAEFRRRAEASLSPLQGLPNFLMWMEEQAIARAVVTNAPKANAEFMLRVLHVTDLFPTLVLGEELPKGKPDPLPYQTALERLGVMAEDAIAFEDSPSGLRSAVAAGISTIGIASTQTPEELYAVGAALVVPNFADPQLWHWLQQRNVQSSLPVTMG